MTVLRGKIVGARALEKRSQGQAPDPLQRLIRRFGVSAQTANIRRCFDLRVGAGRSSLNADGSPVQFALSLAARRPTALEFVGEDAAGDYAMRQALGIKHMEALAQAIGAQNELSSVRPWLEAVAGTGPAGDCEDPAGAFWIGASFDPRGGTAMTVYANARRGDEEGRWQRLTEPRIRAVVEARGLKPLGAGIRLSAGVKPRKRVYFGAYGVTPDEYRRMFRESGCGTKFDEALDVFFAEMLRDERAYPTRSAVCSFGFDDGEWQPKLELCTHCAWQTDSEATERCAAWLEQLGLDADLYRDVVEILAREHVHAFVGTGMKRGEAYASIYLNPGSAL